MEAVNDGVFVLFVVGTSIEKATARPWHCQRLPIPLCRSIKTFSDRNTTTYKQGSQPWTIGIAIDLIVLYQQPAEANVEVIIDDDLRVERGKLGAVQEKQPAKRKRK